MKKLLCMMLALVLLSATCVCAAPVDMQIDVTNVLSKLVALKTDGTVKIHGYNFTNNNEIAELSGVKQIACEDFVENSFFALMEDGTVKEFYKFKKAEFAKVSAWTDIVEIDGGNAFLAGLKSDGTVVVEGLNAGLVKDALKWQNVKSIYAKEDAIIGLTAEGKVLAAGLVGITAKDKVKNWTGMKKVVFDTRDFWGINANGELVTTDTRYKISRIPGAADVIKNIKDFEVMSGLYSRVIILVEDGTLYELDSYSTSNGSFKMKKLYEDVAYISAGGLYYAGILKDGEIISDKFSGFSEEWILGIDIRVAGKYVDCDVQPYIKNDRTMVPIRAISEALGAEVGYDDATKTAIISKDGKTVKVTMGSTDAFVDEAVVSLDAPAENVGGRIFVPVRFVSEGLGCSVKWIGETKSVLIN